MSQYYFIPDDSDLVPFGTWWQTYLLGNIGFDNNNPGNIRYSADITWQGQIGQANGFVKFSDMAYGYRALMKNLQAYIHKGKNTIEKIIATWAPASDGNNTTSYIKNVSQRTGIPANKEIYAEDLPTLAKLASAISISEIGQDFPFDISEALQMMQGQYVPPTPPVVDFKIPKWVPVVLFGAAVVFLATNKPKENS